MIHQRLMEHALALAALGRGWVEPNPMVGAVIAAPDDAARFARPRSIPRAPAPHTNDTSDAHGGDEVARCDVSQCVVGEGWHRRCGGPHAEVQALRDCRARGVDPAGLTMYVTLEPCAHHGQTPPCTDALIEAKLAKVVAAMTDPSPRVAGQGVKRLREAGVEVEVGLGEKQARRLNEAYLKRVASGGALPWVIAKWAQTLDGKIASATGDSRWISSDASRRRVHERRAQVDAIMVGIATALTDRPTLTARGVELRRTARRVVVDPNLRLPLNEGLATSDHPPLMLAADQASVERDPAKTALLRRRGVEVVALTERCGRRLDLRPLLEHLAREHDATNVLVEGGAGLLGSLFEQGQVDQVLAFVAPRVAGDAEAVSAVRGLPCEHIADTTPLELRRLERIGDDVLLDYRVPGNGKGVRSPRREKTQTGSE